MLLTILTKLLIDKQFIINSHEIFDYILRNYVRVGINELDLEKLDTILNAKYGGIIDAKKQLGEIKDIKNTFIDFQKYLYVNSSTVNQ